MSKKQTQIRQRAGYINRIIKYKSGNTRSTWIKDLRGLREGRLMVVSLVENDENRIENKPTRWKWLCRCDCGKEVSVFANNLGRGHSLSCGCLGRENATKSVTIHGLGNTPEYRTWAAMMARCYSPKHKKRKNYLDRGITVCGGWQRFESFYSDMGKKPKGMTIDRINNNLGYNCGKCNYCINNGFKLNARWASLWTQSRNKSNNRFFSYKGETMIANDWAERYGLDKGVIRNRLVRGWSVERAIGTIIKKKK